MMCIDSSTILVSDCTLCMSLSVQSIPTRYPYEFWHQISLDGLCCLKYNMYIQIGENKIYWIFFL